MSDLMSVVVMTRDRWPDLERSLAHHEYPVIVVDNGSTDGTPEKVRANFPDVEVVELGRNLGAGARNVGVERATTPYVAFADDDSWWAPGALTRAAHLLEEHPSVALLAGRMLIGDDQRPDPICEQMRDSPLGTRPGLPGPSVLGFLACGAVVRRDAFLAAGGFDDVVFFMGEEERLALDLASAGWEQVYVEELVAHHHPSPARDPRARQARSARNRLLTALMRRPYPVAVQTAWEMVREGPAGRSGLRAAMPLIPRALGQRRRLPSQVEAARRLLDGP